MLIKADVRDESTLDAAVLLRWITKKKVLLITLIMMLSGGLIFGVKSGLKELYYSGYYGEIKYIFLHTKISDVFDNYLFVPNYVRSFFTTPKHIYIDIKHTDFQKLAEFRRIALERNQITDDLKQYVPAKIRYENNLYEAKVRLKGEWLDNVMGDKWSLRVGIKNKDAIFGMRRFSLQHPRARNYIYEWLFLKALKEEGVVALRYDFINVTLNGKDLGIFAIEEHFDKVLIENNRQREGVIVRFNSDYRFRPVSIDAGRANWNKRAGLNEQHASNIEVYDAKRVLADPNLKEQFRAAHRLLHGLRTKRLPTHKAFDAPKLARYFAISDLLGAQQAPADWSDMRFYYNPVTGLLEPIGVEGHVKEPIASLLGSQRPIGEAGFDFHDILFSDPVFYRHYVQSLERVSNEVYLDRLLDKNKDALKEKLTILFREWPYRVFTGSWLRENQATIRGFLNPSVGLHGYWNGQSNGYLWLDLANIQYMPIEVLGVSIDGQTVLPAAGQIILSPRKNENPPAFRRSGFRLPAGAGFSQKDMPNLKLHYKILGASKVRYQPVFPWPIDPEDTSSQISNARSTGNADQFEFIAVDKPNKTIVIPSGTWTLSKELVVPEGYLFVIEAGTRLTLTGAGSVVSYSPLDWRGSSDQPIVIEAAADGRGGLAVFQASDVSRLSHVTFRNLSDWNVKGRSVSGAVTFFESPVVMRGCQFIGLRGEDSLNIVRDRFELRDVLFDGGEGDALDADFATGRIVHTSFLNSGNDAIDVSGSHITIESVSIKGVQDKALSVGENSVAQVSGLEIENAELAITSKDLSEIRLSDSVIRNSRVGLIAFKKKLEFGPASIIAEGLTLENVEVDFLVETGSEVRVNGKSIPPNHESVKSILYGVQYGISS